MFKNRKIQLRSDKASTPDTRGWRRPFARIFSCGAGGAGGAGRPSCSLWRAPPRCSSTPPTQASVVGCAEGQSSPSRSLPHHTLMLLDPLDPLTRTMLVARRRHSDVLRRPRRVAAAQPPLAEIPSSIIAILLTLIAGHACAELNATSVFAAIDSRSAAHTRSSLAERPSASRRRSRRGPRHRQLRAQRATGRLLGVLAHGCETCVRAHSPGARSALVMTW